MSRILRRRPPRRGAAVPAFLTHVRGRPLPQVHRARRGDGSIGGSPVHLRARGRPPVGRRRRVRPLLVRARRARPGRGRRRSRAPPHPVPRILPAAAATVGATTGTSPQGAPGRRPGHPLGEARSRSRSAPPAHHRLQVGAGLARASRGHALLRPGASVANRASPIPGGHLLPRFGRVAGGGRRGGDTGARGRSGGGRGPGRLLVRGRWPARPPSGEALRLVSTAGELPCRLGVVRAGRDRGNICDAWLAAER